MSEYNEYIDNDLTGEDVSVLGSTESPDIEQATITNEDGQLEIDFRLDSERNFIDNIDTMVKFASSVRDDIHGNDEIRSKQEGYGYLAERFSTLSEAFSSVKKGMGKFVPLLSDSDTSCADAALSVFASCKEVVSSALFMAAEAQKVGLDLYSLISHDETASPLEEYADSLGFEEISSEASDDSDDIE